MGAVHVLMQRHLSNDGTSPTAQTDWVLALLAWALPLLGDGVASLVRRTVMSDVAVALHDVTVTFSSCTDAFAANMADPNSAAQPPQLDAIRSVDQQCLQETVLRKGGYSVTPVIPSICRMLWLCTSDLLPAAVANGSLESTIAVTTAALKARGIPRTALKPV
jgi:hypothetical protein